MLPHSAPKGLIVGHPGFVERLQIDLDETIALFVGDLEVAVHVDDVGAAELLREARRAGLSGPGELHLI